ncbi:MAG: trypsin-like peptidase domain-containing protein [Patescibacteria group bacterium]
MNLESITKQRSTIIIGFLSGMAGSMLVLLFALPFLGDRSLRLGSQNADDTTVRTTSSSVWNSLFGTDAESSDTPIVRAVESASPAVVSIIISEEVRARDSSALRDPFFRYFFGDDLPFETPREPGTKEETGGGSGFLVSSDGLIATNKHVVDNTDAEYAVYTNDGKKHLAKVVALDPVYDIALIKIEGSGYAHLSFGNSDTLRVGETAIAIGNALAEFRNTVSVGVISGLSRSIVASDLTGSAESLEDVIQTDAAINPGNSGGPLLDTSGRVVGMNVAVAYGSQSIGFALPGNEVKKAVESVLKHGTIKRAFLGVRYVAITPEIAQEEGLSVDEGILILPGDSRDEPAVVPGSPAAKAGLRAGDSIIEIDGTKLTLDHTLSVQIRKKDPGETIRLRVLRGNTELLIDATLGETPKE